MWPSESGAPPPARLRHADNGAVLVTSASIARPSQVRLEMESVMSVWPGRGGSSNVALHLDGESHEGATVPRSRIRLRRCGSRRERGGGDEAGGGACSFGTWHESDRRRHRAADPIEDPDGAVLTRGRRRVAAPSSHHGMTYVSAVMPAGR